MIPIKKYIAYAIILFNLGEVFNYLYLYISAGKIQQLYSYSLHLLIGLFSVIYFIKNYQRIKKEQKLLTVLYLFLIIYILIGFLKQFFEASGIFPNDRLRITMALLSFGSVFFIAEPKMFADLVTLWFKWIPPMFLLFVFIFYPVQYISYFFFVPFFLIILPLFAKQHRIILLLIILLLLSAGIVQRMDILSVSLPVLVFIFSKFKISRSSKVLLYINNVFLMLPWILLFLAVTSNFNILALDQFIDDSKVLEAQNDKLNTDTRTFLYRESIESAKKNNYVLLGRTPYYGYDSKWIELQIEMFGSGRTNMDIAQRASEVFIINIFTWFGILGVILFFLLFVILSNRAIQKSNNSYLRYLGLYFSIYWLTAWISHPWFGLNMDIFVFFIVIGIISSNKFLSMSDSELKEFFTKEIKVYKYKFF